MQEAVESWQKRHEEELSQVTEELHKTYEARIQEAIEDLQKQHEAQLSQVTEELQKTYEARMQEYAQQFIAEQSQSNLAQTAEELEAIEAQNHSNIDILQEQYASQLQQATEELASKYEAEKQSAINQLQAAYEDNLRLTAEQFQDQEVQMQTHIKLLQEHYEAQLKQANQELQANEAYTQQTIRTLQTHYESQLGNSEFIKPQDEDEVEQQEVMELVPTETPITSDSVPIKTEDSPIKIPTFNLIPKSIAQDLESQITAWGNACQISIVSQLISYSTHQNAQIRKLVALGLGKIAAANGFRVELLPAIPILGKLSKDLDAQVRLSAVEALGAIKSDKVIPFLQSSLRDTDGLVVQAANLAIGKFRYYPTKSAAKPKDAKLNKPQR